MAVELQELRAVVRAEIKDFEERMNKAGKDAETFEVRWSKVGQSVARTATAVATSIAAIGAAMTVAARKFIASGEEQRRAIARLDTVFKATGHSAGITTRAVLEFAAARQAVTNFGDEVTIQGAAILATFRSIRGEAFLQTLTLAQDLAELIGGDLQGAVSKMGRAMEDPVQGLRGLKEAGVVFTEAQREVIKSLVEGNRLHEAQAMVLDAVRSRIGGTAVAAQSPLIQLQNLISDVAEDIGLALLPAFREFAGDLSRFINENRGKLVAMARSFMEFGLSITKFLAEHPRLSSFLGLLAVGKLTGINSAVGSLAGAIGNASKGFSTFSTAGGAAASSIARIGTAAALLKGGLVALAVVGIAAVATAIYKLMPSIRAWNRETEKAAELNQKLADRAAKNQQAILDRAQGMDPGQRQAFLQQELEMAQKNLKGLESSLEGAKKQYDAYNNGWREFTGNKMLQDFENQVNETTEAVERQKALIETIKGELEATQGLMMPVQPAAPEDEMGVAPAVTPEAIPVTVEPIAPAEAAVAATAAIPTGPEALQAALPELAAFGNLLNSLKGTIPTPELDQFFMSAMSLREALLGGQINADQFSFELQRLTDSTNAAADAAREEAEIKQQQALIAGDFEGAGLDFDKAVQDRIASMRMQQFTQQVDEAARKLLGMNEATSGVTDKLKGMRNDFQMFGERMQGFGDSMRGMSGDVKGGGEQAQQAFSQLANFLSSREGQIAAMQNQISNLQQFLSLENLGYRKRQAIIDQIEALAMNISALMQSAPPVLGPWRTDPAFEDPGLEGDRGGGGGVTQGPTVVVNSIFPPSAADRRMLVAAVVDELARSGWRV